ncbi:MAG TPA: SDR family oxidoreductase [Vicinamibacterales bacterium]|nr:SDR family oxidoreductase [Vicinamibacterales bacterium]
MLTVVTGASGGIGEAIARELARRKSDLVLVARSADKLRRLADELARTQGVQTHIVAADLAAPGSAARVVDQLRAIGRVDVLVNNAGFATFGPFADTDLATEIDEIRLNVETLTELTKRLLPDLLAAKGKILNVASTAAFQPGPLMAVYYATKAYVLSFSEALWEELRGSGVTVTCLCPGPTRTGFQSRAGQQGLRLLEVGLMDAGAVAQAGVRGLFRGRRVVVPGAANRVGAWIVRISPTRAVLGVIKWLHGRVRGS